MFGVLQLQLCIQTVFWDLPVHGQLVSPYCHKQLCIHIPQNAIQMLRLHCMHCQDVAYCYTMLHIPWSLCVSSVCWAHLWAVQNDWTIGMPFGWLTYVGPRNSAFDRGAYWCHLANTIELSMCSVAPCGLRGIMRPWLNFLFQCYILFACLYRRLPHLFFFSSLFLTYLLPYSSFPLRIDPLCFQTRCRNGRLNMVSFLCLFCVVMHFFWLVNAYFCCVRFSFFHTKPRDWLGETSLKWPILWRLGSISHV